MKTEVLNMTAGVEENAIKKAGKRLMEGGLVAFPTETVYGLGADALNEEAAAKIYAAKGRPSDNPLIVHIADLEALNKIVKKIPAEARKLAAAFWPGPLTMIFEKNSCVPDGTTGGMSTVAVRMPDHALALALIRSGGGYIAAPSANSSGRPSPTTAEHVWNDLNGKIDCIVDGGAVGIGLESTIVDLTVFPPMILRPGYITQEMLEEVLGETVLYDPAILTVDAKTAPKAPGMKYRHYAPKADMIIVKGADRNVIEKINEMTAQETEKGKTCGVIAAEETANQYRAGVVKTIGCRSDDLSIAQHLYSILREFDEMGIDLIYSEAFVTPRLGDAIMNRLVKAAGHQIMEV